MPKESGEEAFGFERRPAPNFEAHSGRKAMHALPARSGKGRFWIGPVPAPLAEANPRPGLPKGQAASHAADKSFSNLPKKLAHELLRSRSWTLHCHGLCKSSHSGMQRSSYQGRVPGLGSKQQHSQLASRPNSATNSRHRRILPGLPRQTTARGWTGCQA